MKDRNAWVLGVGWEHVFGIFQVLLFSLFTQSGFAAGSKGTDFWFAFPRGSALVSSTDQATVSFIITGTPGATGNISSSTQSPTTSNFQLNTSGYYQWTGGISGTPDPYQTTGNDVIGMRSFHVTASSSVSIQPSFQVLTGSNPPIASWQAISTEALGKEYFVLAYGNSSTASNSEGTEFVVVGTVNGTLVTITPSVAVGSRTTGVPYQITLNQGETYRAWSGASNADFTGTFISANQQVAVIAGHTCALIPTSTSICSTVLEQIFPRTGGSKKFILSPLAGLPPGTNGDRIRFIANYNDTVVNVNNTSVRLNSGEWYETSLKTFSVNPDPILISSNFPIMVAQYMKDQGDYTVASRFEPSMLMVPGFDHYLTNTTFNLPINGFSNYVNLVAPTSQISSMTLDGIPISPTSFTPVGSSGYSRAILQINPGNASGNHTILGPLPFGAMIYGQSSVQNAFAGFGSIAGFNMPYIVPEIPTLSISNSPQTYTGSPIAATVSCLGGGTVSNVLYGSSSTAPTNAGTYAVTANCAASTNYSAVTGASAGNFVISSATPTLSVTNSPQTYTGSAIPAVVSCLGGGSVSNVKYNNSSTVPSAVASYAITADCAASANYSAVTGASAGNFVIAAAPTPPTPFVPSPTMQTTVSVGGSVNLSISGGNGNPLVTYTAVALPQAQAAARSAAPRTGGLVCTIVGSVLTPTGGTGVCQVTAAQGAYGNYQAQTTTFNITVTAVPPPPQPVPSLSEWAQIMMMFLMILTVGWYGRRLKQR